MVCKAAVKPAFEFGGPVVRTQYSAAIEGPIVKHANNPWRKVVGENYVCADWLGVAYTVGCNNAAGQGVGWTNPVACPANSFMYCYIDERLARQGLRWAREWQGGKRRAEFKLTEDYTYSIWVCPTKRVNDWARVIGKGDAHNRNFGLWIHPDGRVLSQIYGPSGGSVSTRRYFAPLHTWTHIAATFSKDRQHTLYINGAQVGSLATRGSPRTDDSPITIGKATFHTGFEGELGGASVIAVAKTAEEIMAEFKLGQPTTQGSWLMMMKKKKG